MSANLATINGKVSYAYQGETPWHKLGKRTPGMRSIEEAIKAGNLDWNVNKQAVFLADGRVVADKYAMVRDVDNAILDGIVGPQYTITQNRDVFLPFQDACDKHGLTIESVGALGNGETVFMLAKLPIVSTPIPGDNVQGYCLLKSGHTGKDKLTGRLTPIRVVCQNTMALAMDDDTMFEFRHTASIGDRIAEVGEMMSRMVAAMNSEATTFAKLYERKLNIEEIGEYIDSVFPVGKDGKVSAQLANKRATVAHLVFNGKGSQLAGADRTGATVWAVYNAVTEYFDHVRPAGSKNSEAANLSALFGASADVKLDALVKARELVAA